MSFWYLTVWTTGLYRSSGLLAGAVVLTGWGVMLGENDRDMMEDLLFAPSQPDKTRRFFSRKVRSSI